MNPLELLKNPNFIKWFGNSSVKDATGAPLRVFHGTTQPDFNAFKLVEDSTLSRMLGPHFAKDHRVTDAFTIGPYARNDKDWFYKNKPNVITVDDEVINEGGRAIPGFLNIKPKKIYQQVYENGAVATDDWAVAEDIAREVFPKRKDLFLEHARTKWPNSTEEELVSLYDNILAGTDKKFKDFGHYARTNSPDYGPKRVRTEIVKEYKNILKDKGYTGLEYVNTSGNEVKTGFDPTAYIAFEPSSFKSQFNRGTYNANDPNILKGLVGAGVVGATLAPQQAQAENWRNYQNKEPALQEPILDPTTLLAGPARWGGGLANLIANTGLNAIMGKLR